MEYIIKNIERKNKDYNRKFINDINYFLEDFNKIKNHLDNYKKKYYEDDEYNIIYHTYYIKYLIKYNLFKDIKNKISYDKNKYRKIILDEFNNLKKIYNNFSNNDKKKLINSLKNFKVIDGIHKTFIDYCINYL